MSEAGPNGADLLATHFPREIRLIENRYVRTLVIGFYDLAPAHYLVKPSSGSGKHHPADEAVPGGQALHVRRVVRLCEHLARSYGYAGIERDLLIAAALVHDLAKFGWDAEPSEATRDGHEQALIDQTVDTLHDLDYWHEVTEIARGHSGRWGPQHTYSNQVNANLGSLLHIADYLASRPDVHVDDPGV